MDWSTEFGTNKALKGNFASSEQEFQAHVEEIKGLLQLSPSDTLLDVGCNTGIYMRTLAPFVRHITGVDSSDALIQQASADLPANAICLVANAMKLPFEDATFDKALMVSTLQYVPEPRRALAEMKRVTKTGGSIFISHIPNLDDKQWYFDGIDALDKSEEEKEKIRTRNNAVTWFSPANFKNVITERQPFFGALL